MYVCPHHIFTTGCAYAHIKCPNRQDPLVSRHRLAAWCQRGCFKARALIRGARKRGVMWGRANVWECCEYERKPQFVVMCEMHRVALCVEEWGLLCRPWKEPLWVLTQSDWAYLSKGYIFWCCIHVPVMPYINSGVCISRSFCFLVTLIHFHSFVSFVTIQKLLNFFHKPAAGCDWH